MPNSVSEMAVVGVPRIDLSGLAAVLYLGGGATALAFLNFQSLKVGHHNVARA